MQLKKIVEFTTGSNFWDNVIGCTIAGLLVVLVAFVIDGIRVYILRKSSIIWISLLALLRTELPVYLFMIGFILIFLIIANYSLSGFLFCVIIISVLLIIAKLKATIVKKRYVDSDVLAESSIWEKKIGNYTFGEIYNSMVSTMVPDDGEAKEFLSRNSDIIGLSSPEPKNLLALYWKYKQYLNAGIGYGSPRHDYNFGYYIVAPKLANYDLAYTKPMTINGKLQQGFANTNEGINFFPLLQKYFNENPEFKKDID